MLNYAYNTKLIKNFSKKIKKRSRNDYFYNIHISDYFRSEKIQKFQDGNVRI